MGKIGKTSALILTLIIAMSCLTLLTLNPANAQSIPKPAMPEFTIHLVGPPFTRNTTYSLDSNTGKIVADIGYTNPYSFVVMTIKNQPFDSSHGSLYYNIQIKNQNTPYKNWTVIRYDSPNPKQTTNSDFTNISLRIEGQWSIPSSWLANTQTDSQVQAMLGEFYYGHSLFTSGFAFSGETSDWSNTQTVSIPANVPLSSSTSPNPTLSPSPTPTVPELTTLAIFPLLIAMLSILVKLKLKSQIKPRR